MMNCTQTDALLDALMDDALSETDRAELEAHCAGCAECGDQLRAARTLRQLFSEMMPEADVPLTAQAAWRGAVKAEAARARRRSWTRWAGGIAAALILALGGFLTLRPTPATVERKSAVMEMPLTAAGRADMAAPMAEMEQNVAVVEADGQEDAEYEAYEESIDTAVSRAMPAREWRMAVDDLDRTCAYMADLVHEYEGSLEEQRYEADGAACANLFIELPAENAADFLAAAAHYGLKGENEAVSEAGNGRVSMLLVLEAKS